MSTLLERKVVHCPYKRAGEYLEGLLHKSAETKAATVTRLDVPMQPEDGPMFHKDVTITYGVGVDPMHFDEPWVVHWEPLNGGPYPTFDGTLTVRSDETYHTCLLELSGQYRPPLGVAGEAFDTLIGSRIAAATGQEFLRKLGAAMEERYHVEEAAKNVATSRAATPT